MGAQLKVVERGFARRQKHENKKLLDILSKESQDAVDALVRLLKSQDEKIVLGAAKAVIELQRDLANDINTDDLQRIIANVKYGGPKELEEDDTPMIDFNSLQKA